MSKFRKYPGFFIDGRIDVPERWNMGVSVDIIPVWTVSLEAEHLRWKGVRSLSRHFVLPSFNPFSKTFIHRFGSSSGAGFGYPNQWIFRAGFEWRVNHVWTFRFGWRHAKSLARSTQTILNSLLQDCVEDMATFGTTWNINKCNEISFCAAYGIERKVKGERNIPHVWGGGRANLRAYQVLIGLAWAWKY